MRKVPQWSIDWDEVEAYAVEQMAVSWEMLRDARLKKLEEYGGTDVDRQFIEETYGELAALARGTQWVGSDKEKHVA